MWDLKYSGQFKKDLKRYKHFPDKIDHLLKVLQQIRLVRLGTHSELFKL